MNRIRISNEVRSHLALHFQKELPGSKFFADSPDVFLNLAQQLFPKVFSSAKPDYDGRIRISLIFPNKIGISNVVHINELSDDEKRRIEIIDRDGKKVRRVKIDRIIPTNECQIILSTNWDLITKINSIYDGQCSQEKWHLHYLPHQIFLTNTGTNMYL